MKFKIKYFIEISDHDGYCSGSECELQIKRRSVIVSVDNVGFNHYKVGQKVLLSDFNWQSCLPEYTEINMRGSCYCTTSVDCAQRNLHGHDYRYTIYSVRRVE